MRIVKKSLVMPSGHLPIKERWKIKSHLNRMRAPLQIVNRNLRVLMKKNWSLYKWAITLHIQWTLIARDLQIALDAVEHSTKLRKTGRKQVRLKRVTELNLSHAITNKLQLTYKMIVMLVVSIVAKLQAVPQV